MAAKPLYDDENFDEDGLLKDGRRLRVGMMMRDSMSPVQRAIFETNQAMRDGMGGPVGHRPGYCFSTDASARVRVQDAYDEYDRQQANAWRTPADLKQDEAKPNPGMTLDQVYAQREVEDQNAWRAK